MIDKLIAAGLALALLGCMALSGVLWFKTRDLDALRDENEALRLSLAGCTARAANLDKDRKSDAQIDAMPDLTIVPDGWLLPPPPGGGGLY